MAFYQQRTDKMIDLRLGDCLALLPDIPDKSVSLILADPPYQSTDCQWDKVIPFESMWEQLNRVIKPNGIIALFGSEPFSTRLRMANMTYYKYDWYWIKNTSTGFPHAKNKPLKNIELISVFSQGACNHKSLSKNRMTYNPQGLLPYNVTRTNRRKTGGMIKPRPSLTKPYTQAFTNYPKMTLEFENEFGLHPTQKPVALLEYLIKTYSDEGDTVLDFCMGSGSTGVACLSTKRAFIGFEKDPRYFAIAEKRLLDLSGL